MKGGGRKGGGLKGRGSKAASLKSKWGLPISPKKALRMRVAKALRRVEAYPDLTSHRHFLARAMKHIVMFNDGNFSHLIDASHLRMMPDTGPGVSSKGKVYRLFYSGEFLFADLKQSSCPSRQCPVMEPEQLEAVRFRKHKADTLAHLTQLTEGHPDHGPIKRLASNPLPKLLAKHLVDEKRPAWERAFLERWLRQLKLAFNMQVSEDVRQKALQQLALIEDEWRALDFQTFQWPSTRADKSAGHVRSFDSPEHGILSFFGYHVGKKSELTDEVRHLVLHRLFQMPLPPILPLDHMATWGAPQSARRLRKMAEAIAAFTRNARRRVHADWLPAISEWERDLQMLHDTLYVGRFDFPWPHA